MSFTGKAADGDFSIAFALTGFFPRSCKSFHLQVLLNCLCSSYPGSGSVCWVVLGSLKEVSLMSVSVTLSLGMYTKYNCVSWSSLEIEWLYLSQVLKSLMLCVCWDISVGLARKLAGALARWLPAPQPTVNLVQSNSWETPSSLSPSPWIILFAFEIATCFSADVALMNGQVDGLIFIDEKRPRK